MNDHDPIPPIRVLIVDDHPIVRDGLVSLLGADNTLKVVGAAHNAEEALSLLDSFPVDVLLLDLHMPGTSGLQLLRTLQKRENNAPATLILSSYEYGEEIYQAVKAGAKGYLSKDVSRAQILSAIKAISMGKTYFPKKVAESIAERETRASLSQREIEILELVAKGCTNKEIASSLSISQFTVRNHLNHACLKLHVSDRTEAATEALQQGIIQMSL